MKKKIQTFKTDEEAERFIATSDLSKYDLSGLKPVKFEFEKKGTQLNMRVPKELLDAVKKRSGSPRKVSSPDPPQIVSSPPRPSISSFPSRPEMTSLPGVPTITSLPGVPNIVTETPLLPGWG